MARIILNTFGSLGDLHPFLAIAIELARRGHQTTVATSEIYREKILAAGVGFAPVRPDVGALLQEPDFIERLWDSKRGTEYLLRELLIPNVEASYEDVLDAARGADLLVTHTAAYGGPIAADKLKMRWVSAVLQPMVFFSAYDPPVIPQARWLHPLHALSPWAFRLTRDAARWRLDRWTKPVRALRRKLGLQLGRSPALEGQFSPYGTIALFSPNFAQPQRDWPVRVCITGFAYYDQFGSSQSERESDNLEAFLQSGPAPVIFTLGSSAVLQAGGFYFESAKAALQTGLRAVLLTGKGQKPMLPPNLDNSIFVSEYAPYSQLLPRAAATVHQGGIGTTAQALHSGKPMLVVPWAHDQPDNAERVRKLGVARVLRRSSFRAEQAAVELRHLLLNPSYAEKARALRLKLLQEDGTTAAADALERILRENPVSAVFRCTA